MKSNINNNNSNKINNNKPNNQTNKVNNNNSTDIVLQSLINNTTLLDMNFKSSLSIKNKQLLSTQSNNFISNKINDQIQQTNLLNKQLRNSDYLTKKQVYDKICQKQRTLLPEYRKKCKTFTDVLNNDFDIYERQKQREKSKIQRISTSRALQKYSKIIKINPQQGKLQKMKIKKQLVKSFLYQKSQKNDIQTKQITLSRKQIKHHKKNNFFNQKNIHINNINSNSNLLNLHNNNNPLHTVSCQYHNHNQILKTQPNYPISQQFGQNISVDNVNKQLKNSQKILILRQQNKTQIQFKYKKNRRFSQYYFDNKKSFNQKKYKEKQNNIEDFQINGWDVQL